jgi:predicted acylesterase/phospholipase RssA
LPARFSDLAIPLAVGVSVRDASGRAAYRLITEGPLPEAVAASCAIPHVFAPIVLDGVRCQDGGAVDRVGMDAYRALWPGRRALVHIVDRKLGREVPASFEGHLVVRSARSRASFFGLGDFTAQAEETRVRALSVLSDGK